jgi:hypothetical protein
VESPDFLTPVAQAQEAGVEVYWLGEQFEAGSLVFEIAAPANLITRSRQSPGLELEYGADAADGGISFELVSYSRQGDGASVRRNALLKSPSVTVRDVQVGPWKGELFSGSSGTRPVNAIVLFVDVAETTVVATGASVSTGVPGTDVNPLLDAGVLADVIQRGLRPYPDE